MTDYNLWATNYDTLYTFDFDYKKYLDQAQKCGPHAKILSLCCGTGRILLKLAQAGFEVWGVDISSKMLAKAQQKCDKLPPQIAARVHLINNDLKTVKIHQKFDMIYIAFLSFHHLTTIQEQLAGLCNIHSLLGEDGVLMIETFQPNFEHFAKELHQSLIKSQISNNRQIVTQRMLGFDHAHSKVYEDFFDREFDATGSFVKSSHRLLTGSYIFRSEMKLLLQMTGFDIKEVLEKKQNNPYKQDSGILTFICRKKTKTLAINSKTSPSYDPWEPTYNRAYNACLDLDFYLKQCQEFASDSINILVIGELNDRIASYLAQLNHRVWVYRAKPIATIPQPQKLLCKNIDIIESFDSNFAIEQKFDLICIPANALATWLTWEEQLAVLKSCAKHLHLDSSRLVIDLFVPKLNHLANQNRQTLEKYELEQSTLFCNRYEKYRYREQVIELDKFYESYCLSGELVQKFHCQNHFRWVHRNELALMLKMAGIYAKFYGSGALDPYNYHSGKMIVVGTKKEKEKP